MYICICIYTYLYREREKKNLNRGLSFQNFPKKRFRFFPQKSEKL